MLPLNGEVLDSGGSSSSGATAHSKSQVPTPLSTIPQFQSFPERRKATVTIMTTSSPLPEPPSEAAAPPVPPTYEEREGRPTPVAEAPSTAIAMVDDVVDRSTRSARSQRSHRSGRSQRSASSSSASTPGYRVVFSSPAQYDYCILLIVSIPLALILVQMTGLLITSAKVVEFERSGAVWILGWSLIWILALYMMVLPKQIDVRSNGTIGIKTVMITYQFGDICHTYKADLGPKESGCSSHFGVARYKFITTLDSSKHVVIRRRGGKWDVVVSPEQTDELLRMLQSTITKLEIQRGNSTGIPAADNSSPAVEGETA